MKTKGMIRHLDQLGRLVLPKEYRKVLQIELGDPVEMTLTAEGVLVKKQVDSCCFCAASSALSEFKGKLICADCIASLRER